VEGPDVEVPGLDSAGSRGALPHVPRGLVRKGDRENPSGLDAVGMDEARDPLGDDRGLPGAGTGEDEERLGPVMNGVPLGRVELDAIGHPDASLRALPRRAPT